jgi:hypothetical protein
MNRFKVYSGDLMGLPTNENHLNFIWSEPDCKVLFSMSRQGDAASCHFASDKQGMKKIKPAINAFVAFVFENFQWCEMILAKIKLDKVKKIVISCNFVWALTTTQYDLYVRSKHGIYN